MSDLDRDTAQVNMPLDARYGRGGIDGALQRRVRLDRQHREHAHRALLAARRQS